MDSSPEYSKARMEVLCSSKVGWAFSSLYGLLREYLERASVFKGG